MSDFQAKFNAFYSELVQPPDVVSGGQHTPPETRLLLLALALSLRPKVILETGYDAGYTTRVLALVTGAKVIGIDNGVEYPGVKRKATEIVKGFPNCELKKVEALEYLESIPSESVDFAFIDDGHSYVHLKNELPEIERVISVGGIVAFHDPLYTSETAMAFGETFHSKTERWKHMIIPAITPIHNVDFGLLIARKIK